MKAKLSILLTTTFLIMSLGVFSTAGYAHHGTGGQFDTSKEIQISGVVTDIKFVNPHSYVYFEITNEDGLIGTGRCELPPGSTLKRNGWTTEMFATGTKVTIAGSPARREEFGCRTETITFADGRVVGREDVLNDNQDIAPVVATAKLANGTLTLADGSPNLNGNWAAERPVLEPGGGMAGGGMGTAMGAGGMEGGMAAGMGAGGRSQFTQTDAGKLASADFHPDDNPRYHCQATNIFHDWEFNQRVNTIEQTDEKIIMTYGFMDIVRTIHLDVDEHPDNIIPSRAGHSIGKWEGDTLVIDTIGFSEGYIQGRSGVMHSDALHIVERVSLSEDGLTLTIAYTGDDAKYLVGTFAGTRSVHRTNEPFEPYNCEDLTQEVVPGF